MKEKPTPTRRQFITSIAASLGLCLVSASISACSSAETSRSGRHSETSQLRRPPARPAARPTAKAPWIYAPSAIVVDANKGRVLFEKNADTRRAVASTQKLMTALLTIERGRLDETITVAKSDTWAEPTKLYLKAGDRYTRRQILGPMLVKSGNDAARFLARAHSGSEAEFGRAMTARARQLGMADTNFVNASGLTTGGQYSTARDMSKLALRAYGSSTIRQYSRLREIAFRYADGRTTTFTATNKLLSRSPYCNGLKTGIPGRPAGAWSPAAPTRGAMSSSSSSAATRNTSGAIRSRCSTGPGGA